MSVEKSWEASLVEQLQARAAQLRVEMSEKLDDAAEDSRGESRGEDSGDRLFARNESEIEIGEAERDRNELEAIERTLGRIREGSYGVCAECGVEIPRKRLEAQPLASRCTSCQEARESRGVRTAR